jgi:hypothetical protein
MDNDKTSFNESLSNFLTECRNGAIEELTSNKRYTGEKNRREDLRSQLAVCLSPEAAALLDDYMGAVYVCVGMEHDKVLLCGLTLTAEMQKRFDPSTPEHKMYIEENQ